MTNLFAGRLDALAGWRSATLARLDELDRFLIDHELRDASCAAQVAALRERMSSEKTVVAVVGEFSRGKSELINAVLLGDSGRRILPATPGRTTMCPVELAYEAGAPPSIALLPIETRRDGSTLAELQACEGAWTRIALDAGDADRFAEAMAQVARTQAVSRDEAHALGLWVDERPDQNPPLDAAGQVEIPVWRHARVNYPHPMLRRGLTVLDTPGLNALGAEPELTLGLLPHAQAVVFVLGADTGVTRSDLELWRDHLASRTLSRFVVLNKIDTLRDPLLDPPQVARQIEAQRQAVALTLGIDPSCVFPLSSREALVARIAGDALGLRDSRLADLEEALGSRLLHQRQDLFRHLLDDTTGELRSRAVHRLGERRRQIAEQTLELRGLRGKSGAKLRAVRQRVAAEAIEFELRGVQIQALRSVHKRMLKAVLECLGSERLRFEVEQMQQAMRPALLNLNARKAFVAMCGRLRGLLAEAQARNDEIHAMLGASYARLNAEVGFALSLPAPAGLQRFVGELVMIESSYAQYLGLTHALRLSQPRFMEQFRRMLLSKLRVVFESAGGDVELWNKSASAQLDTQLAERRNAFTRRNRAIERIEQAAGELERRLAELAAQDARLQHLLQRLGHLAEALRHPATDLPEPGLALPMRRAQVC